MIVTRLIAPACLWTLPNGLQCKTGFAVGWGINEAGEYSEHKKHVALEVQDVNVCKQFDADYVDENFFCAATKGSTPCEYDDPHQGERSVVLTRIDQRILLLIRGQQVQPKLAGFV